ncbi:MAG: type II toxin-antitoxin system Phd/YefM family antitoxin [Ferrimicrobium sp.]
MSIVGIRALKQNASQVVARAAAGEVVTITDRGRAVAQLVPVPAGRVAAFIASGRAREAKGSLAALGAPCEAGAQHLVLSEVLATMRDEERY